MLKDCQSGGRFEGTVLITEWKETPFRQKPGSFLLFTCQDVSGMMSGKIWDPKPDHLFWLKEHDVYRISAKVTEFKGTLDLTVDDLTPVDEQDVDWTALLPSSPYSAEELEARLQNLLSRIKLPQWQAFLNCILAPEELGTAFRQAPAAMRMHQPYLRGLWEHSVLVAEMAQSIGTFYPEMDEELLIIGALLHDIGKIHEYSYGRGIAVTSEGRLLGHIVMGVDLLGKYIAAIPDFPADLRMKFLHIIASHHGRYEWQSPKRPKSREALLVHYVDALEADLWQFYQTGQENPDQEWSPYVRSLERYLLLK
ncbi:MAG: HD domain-containing protein [Peptococcaceae bacterium]|jgi:3'-5' exoribonuclease|nr:HD domain-containing protein [Peptococcaceae bacterium]